MTVTMKQHGVYRRRDGGTFTQSAEPCRKTGLWKGSDGYIRSSDGLWLGPWRAEASWDAIEDITPATPALITREEMIEFLKSTQEFSVACNLDLAADELARKLGLTFAEPEPVRDMVTLFGEKDVEWVFGEGVGRLDTHSITLTTIGGDIPTGVFYNEDNEIIIVEKINET